MMAAMRESALFHCLGFGLAMLLGSAGAAAQSAPPRFELEIDLPDDIVMAMRPSSIGTNVRNARVQRQPLKPGRIEQIVSPPIVAALGACTAVKANASRLRIRVGESAMKDSIGDSSTNLKGIGLYLSLPEIGVVDTGTWSVAPFVAVVVELKDETGRVLASQQVTGYERETAPEGMTASDFLAKTSSNLDGMLEGLVRGRLEKAMPLVLAGVCAPR
jgi:hypothetical protein